MRPCGAFSLERTGLRQWVAKVAEVAEVAEGKVAALVRSR
ncbi:MAG: hypothetical protein ACFWUL_06105 [Dialister sp.]|jgi:hypothetical protein